MEELAALPGGDAAVVPSTVHSHHGLFVEQGRILRDRTLARVASRHDATPAQVALAWLLRQGDLMVIPKAQALSMRENRAAVDLALTQADLAELAGAFPPPSGASPLEML
jgi:diketogulonate reductase-like aldo/keto reductase